MGEPETPEDGGPFEPPPSEPIPSAFGGADLVKLLGATAMLGLAWRAWWATRRKAKPKEPPKESPPER